MSRSADLKDLLSQWPYEAEDNVRVVRGEDGREIMQVRTPVGLEQYEMEGRPDGLRPHGAESLLDYQVARLEAARAAGRENTFHLDGAACGELFFEGTLYYYRYLHLFQLKDWARAIRDTARNGRLFDFVKAHAEREEDRAYLEQWRPYVVRMNAVASAMQALGRGDHRRALRSVQQAVRQIEQLDDTDDETFRFERQRSLLALRELAREIEQTRPLPELERLERQLQQAVEQQEFELAAQLRDRIRSLRGTP